MFGQQKIQKESNKGASWGLVSAADSDALYRVSRSAIRCYF